MSIEGVPPLAEIDIDTRISYIWEALFIYLNDETLGLTEMGNLMRCAYGQGYSDALKEPRGKFMIDNGYRVPSPFDESKE